jgi:rhodanese-related sulfurtransferase
MTVQRFHDETLDQYSYLVTDGHDAIAIDPGRRVQPYLDYLGEHKLHLRAIVMTHTPGAFASGWAELRTATGAEMVGASTYHFHGEGTFREAGRATMIPFGEGCHLQTQLTPGYTADSICALAIDADRKVHAIFTGGTLLNMGAGYPLPRPGDKNPLHGPQTYAKQEYTSIHKIIGGFDDRATVYSGFGEDAHFAKMGDHTHSHFNLTEAKDESSVFKKKNEKEFTDWLTEDYPFVPAYVNGCQQQNPEGYPSWADAMTPFGPLLPEAHRPPVRTEERVVEAHDNVVILEETETAVATDATHPRDVGVPTGRVPIGGEEVLLIDTRDAADFREGHAPGAINIQRNGPFALWLGTIVRPGESFRLLVDQDEDAAYALAEGVAKIGYDAQLMAVDRFDTPPGTVTEPILDTDDFRDNYTGRFTIVDVRPPKPAKTDTRFYGAINVPIYELRDRWAEIPQDRPIVVHCGGGYQSAIGAGILRRHVAPEVVVYDLGEEIKKFEGSEHE